MTPDDAMAVERSLQTNREGGRGGYREPKTRNKAPKTEPGLKLGLEPAAVIGKVAGATALLVVGKPKRLRAMSSAARFRALDRPPGWCHENGFDSAHASAAASGQGGALGRWPANAGKRGLVAACGCVFVTSLSPEHCCLGNGDCGLMPCPERNGRLRSCLLSFTLYPVAIRNNY
jgi:hypothetical protein